MKECIKCGKTKEEKWEKSSYCRHCASDKARKWELSNPDRVNGSIERRRLKRQTTVCEQCKINFLRKRGEKVCSLRCKLLNEKLVDQNGCWISPSIGSRGYGQLSFRGMRNVSSHRVSFNTFNGEIPSKTYVCHKCDNPRCYNPQHLFLGSAQDNIQDGIKKGRIKHIGAKERNCRFTNLTKEQIDEIRLLHKEGLKCSRLSRIFRCGKEYVSKIIRYKVRK